ncbi:unnamed protein product [Staurois parvus]|uniref:Uncharacterized protein n=1 Tax=Staurois parvus TaxID=386267 RepID=A0ABN9C5R6_9NEOB|nr:unnamed protein product [Staurois parvus]
MHVIFIQQRLLKNLQVFVKSPTTKCTQPMKGNDSIFILLPSMANPVPHFIHVFGDL